MWINLCTQVHQQTGPHQCPHPSLRALLEYKWALPSTLHVSLSGKHPVGKVTLLNVVLQ